MDQQSASHMEHRRVGDLMTHNVVTVRGSTPFKEIARTLADNDVSAVPVTDTQGRIVGIVSEADLLTSAAERADQEERALIRPVPESVETTPDEGRTAEELMSSPAVCIGPRWTVVEAARLMALQQVKRLPVVDEADRLVGIVSRADLLRVFLRSDKAIADEIQRDLLDRTLRLAPSDVNVSVHDGKVTLSGTVPEQALIPVLDRLCASIDGVVSCTLRLTAASAADGSRFKESGATS